MIVPSREAVSKLTITAASFAECSHLLFREVQCRRTRSLRGGVRSATAGNPGWGLRLNEYDSHQPCSPMNLRLVALAVLILIPAGCKGEQEQPNNNAGRPGALLRVHTTQRSAFQIVGGDTLSDSARVLEIHPEQDGDALVAIFSDPARRVSAGLAIVDRKMAAPQLVWPDSVNAVWWTGPHTLAFTTATGGGIRLIVDVHAAALRVADTAATLPRPAGDHEAADSTMLRRAQAYTDSVRGQVGGTPQASALTYGVTRLVRSRDGRSAAFHTAARDGANTLTNPGWYVLDRESGAVSQIDQVTGPAAELAASAGQWSDSGSFFYAKGRAIWEAEIARSSTEPTTS